MNAALRTSPRSMRTNEAHPHGRQHFFDPLVLRPQIPGGRRRRERRRLPRRAPLRSGAARSPRRWRHQREGVEGLEIALAGETLWNKFDRAEDRAFRQQLAAYLQQLPMPELQGKQEYRKKILQDIRTPGRRRSCSAGSRRRPGPPRRADGRPQRPAENAGRRKAGASDMAGLMKQVKLEALAWLLEQQPQPDQSVLVVVGALLLPAPGRGRRAAGPRASSSPPWRA